MNGLGRITFDEATWIELFNAFNERVELRFPLFHRSEAVTYLLEKRSDQKPLPIIDERLFLDSIKN